MNTKPWQRLPNETDKAFAAFQIYMNLPVSGRSLDEAYRVYVKGNEKAKKQQPTGHFTRWSTSNNWVNRASAHDDYLNEKLQQELDDKIIANRKTRIQSYEALRAVALRALKDLDIDKATLAQITNALKTANEGELGELGEDKLETQINITNNTGIDASMLDKIWGNDE